MTDTPLTKADLLDRIEEARSAWDDLIEQISPAWMLLPVTGGWTIKDIIAHVTWFEQEMLVLLRTRALTGSDLWGMPTDERNAAIYHQNSSRSLDDILAEAARVYPDLLRELDALEDPDLVHPARFADMPDDWLPGQVLAENTYEHYQAHLPAIRAWLEEG